MAAITLIEAVNMAMAYEMENDKEVVVFGEDVARVLRQIQGEELVVERDVGDLGFDRGRAGRR